MSALLSVKLENTIQLFTDGATYAKDGTVVSFVRKVFAAKTAPVAIGVRGFSGWALEMASDLCELADQRGVPGFFAYLMEAELLMKAHSDKITRDRQFHYTIALAMPGSGVAHYVLHCVPEFKGFPCYTVTELDTLNACGSMFTADELYQRGILPASGDPTEWAKTQGVEIMELMRGRKGDPLSGMDREASYIIGGHVDLATVTESGATIERLRVWPDKVGEKIDPYAGNPKVTAMLPRKVAQAALSRKTLRTKRNSRR